MNRKQGKGAGDPLDALLEAAVDAIVIADGWGRILRFSRSAQELFGYTEAEAQGQYVSLLMPEPYRSQHDVYLRAYREGGPASIIGIGREIVGQKADGEVFPIHLSVGEIAAGADARFVGIIRDLSAEKLAEATVRELETHLAHADRLVMLGELTAGIAHEINQPLTAIAAYADAGTRLSHSEAPGAKDELDNICARVAEQARRAADVVTRLRMLSRRATLRRDSHDPSELVTSVLLLFEHELANSGITLEAQSEPDLPPLNVDEIQLQQVMVNLIKNSIDALKSARIPEPGIRVRLARAGNAIEFSVRDNGPGVPEKLEPRLFEPFFTTKLRGVGLGLSICRNIAVAHGGTLKYGRAPDGGAEFTLSLPLDYIG
jgi:two-component system sensor kinase FixL